MLRSIVLALLLLLAVQSTGFAQQRPLGLGIIVGEPTGLSGKWWTGKRTALDAAVGWSFARESALHLHADYLFHHFDLLELEDTVLPVYFGIGGRIKLEDESRAGVRIPVGIAYVISGAPLDFFFELVPLLDLTPDTDFRLNGSAGMRYFF